MEVWKIIILSKWVICRFRSMFIFQGVYRYIYIYIIYLYLYIPMNLWTLYYRHPANITLPSPWINRPEECPPKNRCEKLFSYFLRQKKASKFTPVFFVSKTETPRNGSWPARSCSWNWWFWRVLVYQPTVVSWCPYCPWQCCSVEPLRCLLGMPCGSGGMALAFAAR